MLHNAHVAKTIDATVLHLLTQGPHSERQLMRASGYSQTGIRHSLQRQMELGIVRRTVRRFGDPYPAYLFLLKVR